MALLFQSNPRKWNLRKYLDPGKYESWFVTRYQSLMGPGQLVLLWVAQGGIRGKSIRGLYGWAITTGTVTTPDYLNRSRISLRYMERWVSKVDKNNKNKDTHSAPIPASIILSLPSWKDHLLAVLAVGTNFLVTEDQMEELIIKIVNLKFPDSKLEQAFNLEKHGKLIDPNKFITEHYLHEKEET